MLASLQTALQNYEASPSNATVAQSVVSAASRSDRLRSTTPRRPCSRSAPRRTRRWRSRSPRSIRCSSQYQTVNNTIVSGLQTGADVTDAEDSRDNILSQLSQQVGISTVTSPNGSESIYTDSGVTLFQTTARTVTFTATPTLTAGATGNAVMVDGVPITGPSSPMAIQSGALAGLATLRDTTAPQYQAQLDQIASGLINAFAETDQTNSGDAESVAGLVHRTPSFSRRPVADRRDAVPAGLAGQIIGQCERRSEPGRQCQSAAATAASHAGGRQQRLHLQHHRRRQLHHAHPADDFADIGDAIVQSVGRRRIERQPHQLCRRIGELGAGPISAGERSGQLFQRPGDERASQALSSATGVNLDDETSQMLSLENSYQTSAKLLTTVNNMFASLLTAVTAAVAA